MSTVNGSNLIRSKQKYGIISQNIMRHSLISATAKALYAYLAGFAGSENTAFPGRDLICHEMGLNKDTLAKYMWELQCWEIIQIEKTRGENGQWDKNIYILDHYPPHVMMERREFEETIWLELQQQIKSKGNKKNINNTQNKAIPPCPKISDTVENELPCLKLPDPKISDPVIPDPVASDTNNNNLKINNLNNNNINNENSDLIPRSELGQIFDVDVSMIENKTEDEHQEVDSKLKYVQIKEKFDSCGIFDLPEKVIKVLQVYTYDEISKVAVTLQNRKKQGKVSNPIGLLVTHPEVIQTILRDEFLPDVPKPTTRVNVDEYKHDGNEYELYVPPEVLEELKNQRNSNLKE